MSKHRKYTSEEKLEIVKEYLSGNSSLKDIGKRLGYVSKKGYPGCFEYWVLLYRYHGEMAFCKTKGNATYTKEFKTMVVEDYFNSGGSCAEIAAKYKLSDESVLSRWISLYNANRELKDYCPKREVYMADARKKTSMEERKEIVKYCIEHGRDYKGTATIYDVSYSQVYSWVKKYDSDGESGLSDRRGRHKTDDEVDELERLRRENARLKRQLQEKNMLAELLKKVQEFERM